MGKQSRHKKVVDKVAKLEQQHALEQYACEQHQHKCDIDEPEELDVGRHVCF
jgi:hypothetical protein